MISQKWQAQHEGLNDRAVEILRLLDEGMSDREIAERLMMTINTVKWYNRQIYSILGVGSRTQAIARARELQILNAARETAPVFNVYFVSLSPHGQPPIETLKQVLRGSQMVMILDNAEPLHSVATQLSALLSHAGD